MVRHGMGPTSTTHPQARGAGLGGLEAMRIRGTGAASVLSERAWLQRAQMHGRLPPPARQGRRVDAPAGRRATADGWRASSWAGLHRVGGRCSLGHQAVHGPQKENPDFHLSCSSDRTFPARQRHPTPATGRGHGGSHGRRSIDELLRTSTPMGPSNTLHVRPQSSSGSRAPGRAGHKPQSEEISLGTGHGQVHPRPPRAAWPTCA